MVGVRGLLGGSPPNQQGHSVYFANQGAQAGLWNAGVDVSAGYHVYGYKFIPGQSITAYFDGRQVWQVDASSGICFVPALSITAEGSLSIGTQNYGVAKCLHAFVVREFLRQLY